jgi:hypothetical protein
MSAERGPERECHEGPEAVRRFANVMTRVLQVSKDELARREAAYKKIRRAKNARRAEEP